MLSVSLRETFYYSYLVQRYTAASFTFVATGMLQLIVIYYNYLNVHKGTF